jgi:hypothetical protein
MNSGTDSTMPYSVQSDMAARNLKHVRFHKVSLAVGHLKPNNVRGLVDAKSF